MAQSETAWDKVERDVIAPDHKPRTAQPVLQDWVMFLGLRLQGVIVSAIRGCDTVQRHDNSKILARIYRSEILRSHAGDASKSKSFILAASIPDTVGYMQKFLNDCDHFPQHYVMHFIHAAEILGYFHPDPERKDMWQSFYLVACRKYHFRPETQAELIERLEKDEDEFHKNQDTTVTARVYEDAQKVRDAALKAKEEEEALRMKRSAEELRSRRAYGGS